MPRSLVIIALLLAGCDGGGNSKSSPRADTWQIGPIINGKNYSPNCPASFTDTFTINPCEPHYVTRPASLIGKTEIRLRYRVEADAGTVIHGAKCASPSAVTAYFQMKDDGWARDGMRWWASFASGPLTVGEHEIVAPLNGKWTSVLTMTAEANPNEFGVAKSKADKVGFTFANCEGLGHGAWATGPVRFVVTHFEVR